MDNRDIQTSLLALAGNARLPSKILFKEKKVDDMSLYHNNSIELFRSLVFWRKISSVEREIVVAISFIFFILFSFHAHT